MTEGEWLVCDDPGAMLATLDGRASERKLRLFAVACCRHAWQFLLDERSRKAVEALERHADTPLSSSEWGEVLQDARLAFRAMMTPACQDAQSPRTSASAAAYAVRHATSRHPLDAAGRTGYQAANAARRAPGADFINTFAEVCRLHARLLHDILGNPFHPGSISPQWETPTVISLTRAVYEERHLPSGKLDPARLAVLSDALEEAGCTDDSLLAHLRSPGPHVRGCWPVDLILAKA